MKNTVVLGAGISGLYTGFRLAENNHKVTLIEKTGSVGGMAKSMPYGEYTLDFGPHKIYTVLPGVIEEYQRITDYTLLTVKKRNSIFLEGKRINFPINPLKAPFQINPISIIKCGLGFVSAKLKPKRNIRTYEDYFLAGFGKASYDLLFRDLALKVWGDPKILTEELARKRVPVPSLITLAMSMFREKPTLSAKYFLYPPGGFGTTSENLKKKIEKLKSRIICNAQPTKIIVKNNRVTAVEYKNNKKSTIKNPDFVVSTIHVQDVLRLMQPTPPKKVLAAASGLRWRGLVLIFLFFERDNVLGENWTFFPERKYIFNRVSEPKSQSKNVAPAGKTYIIAEVTLDPQDPLFSDDK